MKTLHGNGTSSPDEVRQRCEKRNTRILKVTTTSDGNYVLVFADGSQAEVTTATLEELHNESPTLWTNTTAS